MGCGVSRPSRVAPRTQEELLADAARDVRLFLAAHPLLEAQPEVAMPQETAVPAEAAPAPHFGQGALLESVESGAIAAVRGRFVVALHAHGGRLARRQDLPAEAFFTAAELRRLVNALGDEYGLLFVALSYRCARAACTAPRVAPRG